MLLSPLSLPQSDTRRRRAPVAARLPVPVASPARRSGADPFVPAFLIAWLALGIGLMILTPAARGGGALGATLPFWLVGAPVLNLLWWRRRECLRVLRRRRPMNAGTARKVR
jgi:hypothetical protein